MPAAPRPRQTEKSSPGQTPRRRPRFLRRKEGEAEGGPQGHSSWDCSRLENYLGEERCRFLFLFLFSRFNGWNGLAHWALDCCSFPQISFAAAADSEEGAFPFAAASLTVEGGDDGSFLSRFWAVANGEQEKMGGGRNFSFAGIITITREKGQREGNKERFRVSEEIHSRHRFGGGP